MKCIKYFFFFFFFLEPFQREMIKQGIVEKLISCLNSNDEDVQCWSILLLHDLSRLGIIN